MRYANYKYFLSTLMAWSSLSLSVHAAPEKTADEYWSETGLVSKHLEAVVTQDLCYRSENFFVSCVEALSELASPLEAGAQLSEWPTEEPVTLIKSFGPLALVKNKKSTKSNSETETQSARVLWEKLKVERSLRQAKLKKVYTLTVSQPLNLQTILQDLNKGLAGRPEYKATLAKAINKFLAEAIDPHSYIVPSQQMSDQMSASGHEYSGIGVYLQMMGDRIMIQNLIEEGPSHRAGVRAKDILVKIDGHRVKGMEYGEVLRRLRGRNKSTVELTLLRHGKALVLSVKREQINQPNVSFKILRGGAFAPVGYLKLSSFSSARSCEDVAAAVQTLEQKGARSLIFDLRGNGGGLVDQAVCIGGLFVGREVIVHETDLRNGAVKSYTSDKDAITNLPLLTLIDAGSASASEIIAGALQDYQRAWVAGQKSFGKGTMQAPFAFTPNGGAEVEGVFMYLTIKRFYQPSGRTNQVVGIIPDMTLLPKPKATADDEFALREGDLFTNALPALGTAWVSPQPEKVKALKECAAKSQKADVLFEATQDEAMAPDYELLQAQAQSECQLKLGF